MRFLARAGAADGDHARLECISLQGSLRLMPTTLGLERFFVRVGAGDADWSASLSGSVRGDADGASVGAASWWKLARLMLMMLVLGVLVYEGWCS